MKRFLLWTVAVVLTMGAGTALTGCGETAETKKEPLLAYDSAKGGLQAYELLEVGFNGDADVKNPYDSSAIKKDAIVHLPDGNSVTVPMFWYEEYERSLAYSVEELKPTGKSYWALRYTPTQSGVYTVDVKTTKEGDVTTESGVYTVEVKPGDKDAFLRVAADRTHLEFSNGGAFTGIGHNLCGWEWAGVDNQAGTYDYDKWFTELKASGANMAQFDLCEGDNIEWTEAEGELPYASGYGGIGYYNQMAAWKTDYKVAACDALGLYYRFSLYHWEDFDIELGNFPDWGWSRNPYNAANGGPCESVSDFFKNEQAKEYTKDYLRYAVARWGYSTNMIMWELWNEADSPDIAYAKGNNYATEFGNILLWHDEMARYVKELDVNRHLVTTSFADSGNADAIWKLGSIDVTTFHRYSMYNSTVEGLYNGVGVLNNIINARLLTYQKPVIAGEFALSPGGDVQRENDPEGIGFHNQIWSSLFAGSFGTAMHWTWGSYLDRLDMYHHYTPLADLLGYEDLRNTVRTNNVNATGEAHLYMTMTKKDRAFVWVKDRNYDYLPVAINGYQAVEMSNVKVPLSGLDGGRYEVIYYDTWNGGVIFKTEIEVAGSQTELTVPSFYKDIAVKVIKTEKAFAYAQLDADTQFQADSRMQYWSDTVHLKAAGADIGGTNDQGGYAYLSSSGNLDMTVKVTKCSYLGENAKAGIMLRSSAASDAATVFLGLNGAGNAVMIVRGASGAEAETVGTAAAHIGDFVKLEKRGNAVTGYVSADGKSWTKVGDYTFEAWEETFLIGVAVASDKPSGYNDAWFEDIQVKSV